MLEELHLDHQGVGKMKALATSYVWWPNINIQIEKLAKGCTVCQQAQHAQARHQATLGIGQAYPDSAYTWIS